MCSLSCSVTSISFLTKNKIYDLTWNVTSDVLLSLYVYWVKNCLKLNIHYWHYFWVYFAQKHFSELGTRFYCYVYKHQYIYLWQISALLGLHAALLKMWCQCQKELFLWFIIRWITSEYWSIRYYLRIEAC